MDPEEIEIYKSRWKRERTGTWLNSTVLIVVVVVGAAVLCHMFGLTDIVLDYIFYDG